MAVPSSACGDPVPGREGTAQRCAGEVCVGCWEIFLYWEGGQTLEQAPGEGLGAPGPPVFERHLANALNNVLELLVSPEVVRQLDWMMAVGPFQLK